MPDPWNSSQEKPPQVHPRSMEIYSRCMNSMENPIQIHGNSPEIHEIQRKTIPDPWKSMRCLSAPNFGRRQNSIRKKNTSKIHEIRRKSMRCLSAPNFGRRQNSIRKEKAQREMLKNSIKRKAQREVLPGGIRGDKEDKGDKGG